MIYPGGARATTLFKGLIPNLFHKVIEVIRLQPFSFKPENFLIKQHKTIVSELVRIKRKTKRIVIRVIPNNRFRHDITKKIVPHRIGNQTIKPFLDTTVGSTVASRKGMTLSTNVFEVEKIQSISKSLHGEKIAGITTPFFVGKENLVKVTSRSHGISDS